jgi:hypothetical protein
MAEKSAAGKDAPQSSTTEEQDRTNGTVNMLAHAAQAAQASEEHDEVDEAEDLGTGPASGHLRPTNKL